MVAAKILAFAALAAAAPTVETITWGNETEARDASEVQARTPGGVEICTDINFKGQCGFKVQPFDVCINLDPPYYHTISSIGPDQGGAIEFHEDKFCGSGASYRIGYPGSSDLRTIGWNDRIGSFYVRRA